MRPAFRASSLCSNNPTLPNADRMLHHVRMSCFHARPIPSLILHPARFSPHRLPYAQTEPISFLPYFDLKRR